MKKIIGLVAIAMLIAFRAMAAPPAITYTNTITTGPFAVGGNSMETIGELNLAGTYPTGGFSVTAGDFGFSHLQSLLIQGEDGYLFWYNSGTAKVMVFQSADPTGTISTPTFTGISAVLSHTATSSTPTFTGVGHTATINLIDNTPVVGYAVYFDPTSGALNYFNVGSGTATLLTQTFTPSGTISTPTITVASTTYTPAGTVSTPTFTGAGVAALVEVTDGNSLASVDKVNYVAVGW